MTPPALDAKDRAIVLAVSEAWTEGRRITFRQLEVITGVSLANLSWRINGYEKHGVFTTWRCGGGLVGHGWLCAETSRHGTLRPGPLFGGLLRNHKTGAVQVLKRIV